MKKYFKGISITLISAMLFSLLPIQALAAGTSEPSIDSIPINQTQKAEGKIIGEITDKRDINIKHFRKDDLTFEADVFPFAVHYKKDGKWEDINNTMVDGVDEENNDTLENKDNSYKVKIAKNTSSSKLVQIQKDGYEVSWNLEGAQKILSQVKSKDQTALNALSENDKKRTLPKLSSTVDFMDIYPNIDLQYEVNPQDIKENIIIKEKVNNPLFIFNLNTKGLIPKLLEDNSIGFYDASNPEKTIFSMDAPYMYDALNEQSKDIVLTLEPAGKGYSLKVQPNNEWLSSSDRVFPIILDPTLQTKQETSNITDNHVSEGLPNSNFENSHMLKTGNSTGGVHRTYIKFNLPTTLTASDMVINANLYMYLLTPTSAFRQVNVHKVLGDWSGSGTDGIKWSNMPAYDSKVVDYQFVKDVAPYYTWDVTSIVKEWFTTGNNYGLMLKNNDEVNPGYTEYVSANTSSEYTPYRACVVLSYINNSGLENYWTYHSQDVGRAGTGYVNDYNGNVIFTHNDIAMNGNKMPISLNHVYNSNDKDIDIRYGRGWRLNLSQRIEEKPINNVQYYIYTDGDGTKHYYTYDSSRSAIVDELSPTDSTLVKNADGTYLIKDKKNNQLNFTANTGSEG